MANMNDEVKEYQSDITALEAEIGDAILCKKVQNAVETPILEDVELSCKVYNVEQLICLTFPT